MRSFRPLLLSGLLILLAGTVLARDPTVAASAMAGGDYLRDRAAKGALAPESYVFAEGRFFGGNTHDHSLEGMTFSAITQALAPSLAKQNYFPTTDVASAQLVIMVHWGVTEIYEDPMKDLTQQALNDAVSNYNESMESTGTADPTALNRALDDRESAQNSVISAVNRNAILLGYARTLDKERKNWRQSTEELTMLSELAEERYFVVLFAYDNQARLKEKKSRPLWITRLSVRSPGNNFTEALPALMKVGADVFGQQRDGLVHVKTPMRRGSVKLGEIEVIGTVNEKPASPPKEK